MRETGRLSQLRPGRRAFVSDIESDDAMRRRLQDLGLIKGTEVVCVQKSPLGDPVAFLIRGAVIALRGEDSSAVQIQDGEMIDNETGTKEYGRFRPYHQEKARFG